MCIAKGIIFFWTYDLVIIDRVISHMKGEDNIDIQLHNEFILEQLLLLANVIDLSDEVGR